MKSNLVVFKSVEFCYAHRLPEHKGKCINLHGHNAKWEVGAVGILTSSPDLFLNGGSFNVADCDYSGMLIDYKDLSVAMKDIIEKYDHAYINDFLTLPTTENLIMLMVKTLVKQHSIAVVESKLWESSTSYVRWKRGF